MVTEREVVNEHRQVVGVSQKIKDEDQNGKERRWSLERNFVEYQDGGGTILRGFRRGVDVLLEVRGITPYVQGRVVETGGRVENSKKRNGRGRSIESLGRTPSVEPDGIIQ